MNNEQTSSLNETEEQLRQIVNNKTLAKSILDKYDLNAIQKNLQFKMIIQQTISWITTFLSIIIFILLAIFLSWLISSKGELDKMDYNLGIESLSLFFINISLQIIYAILKIGTFKKIYAIIYDLIKNEAFTNNFLDYPEKFWPIFFNKDASVFLKSASFDEKITNQWLSKEDWKPVNKNIKTYWEFINLLIAAKNWDTSWEDKFEQRRKELFDKDNSTGNIN